MAISIETVKGFGKKPQLWIACGNQMRKVASFSSNKAAEDFQDILEYFFGDKLEKGGEE